MIFFVYAAHDNNSIGQSLGAADYSYFFVMKLFRPILERFGQVVIVDNVAEIDVGFAAAQAEGASAILLSFAPPHKTPLPLHCPIIPVFAWEYSSIPNEAWGADWRHNWAQLLSQVKGAITHSKFAVAAVQQELGAAYPIVSMPAPVWDTYAKLYPSPQRAVNRKPWRLVVESVVVLDSYLHGASYSFAAPTPDFAPQKHRITLNGIVYTAVFNPNDGRKNWIDLISAFCFAFRDNPNVTLLMKLIHHDPSLGCGPVWHEMKKLSPYRCRIVAIQGYLDTKIYRKLVANSTFIVNSAYGEGQCLPLMEFMSAGKPAIAPDHTAMADYLCPDNAFVVRSNKDWTHWCHDPRLVLRAFRYRIEWESLRDAFSESYTVVSEQPEKYLQMSKCATSSLRAHCSRSITGERFSDFLQKLGYKRRSRITLIADMTVRRLMRLGVFPRCRGDT